MKVTRHKNCYCHTCDKDFHYLGITRHRAAHMSRGEKCVITYTHGDTWTHTPPRHLKKQEQKMKQVLYTKDGKPTGVIDIPDDIVDAANKIRVWLQNSEFLHICGVRLIDPSLPPPA